MSASIRWRDIRHRGSEAVQDWRNVTVGSVLTNRAEHSYSFSDLPVVPTKAQHVNSRGVPYKHFIAKVLRTTRCYTDDEILRGLTNAGPEFVPGHEVALEIIETHEECRFRPDQRGAMRVRNLCGCKHCTVGQTHFCQGPFDSSNTTAYERGIAVKEEGDASAAWGGFRELMCLPDDALTPDTRGLCRPKDLALAEPMAIAYNCLLLAHAEGAQIPEWAKADRRDRNPVVVVLGLGVCGALAGIAVHRWKEIFCRRYAEAQAEQLTALVSDVKDVLRSKGIHLHSLDILKGRFDATLRRLDPVGGVRGNAGWFPSDPFRTEDDFEVVYISRANFPMENENAWDPRWRTVESVGRRYAHYVSTQDLSRNETGFDFAELVRTHPAFKGRFPSIVLDFSTSALFTQQAFRPRAIGGFGGADTVCVQTSAPGEQLIENYDCGTNQRWSVINGARTVSAVNFPFVAQDMAVELNGLINRELPGFWDFFVQDKFRSPEEFAIGAIEAHHQPGVFRVALDPNG
ncbi:MAG: alcohol dehydrogenase catalytic domain-containing protein [Bdellovibrionota bacterium]